MSWCVLGSISFCVLASWGVLVVRLGAGGCVRIGQPWVVLQAADPVVDVRVAWRLSDWLMSRSTKARAPAKAVPPVSTASGVEWVAARSRMPAAMAVSSESNSTRAVRTVECLGWGSLGALSIVFPR